MSCVNHGRTKGEGCGHVKSIYVPQKTDFFTHRSKAVLLLWYTISVIVCLYMYVVVKF